MKQVKVLLLLLCISQTVSAQPDSYINFSPGLSFAFPSPLIVNQESYPRISMWANYKTEPLILPVYYSYRLGFKNQNSAWDLEMNHLKIILKNTSDEIQQFSISHGYNQLFVSHTFERQKYGINAGAEAVLAHPENIVRNLQLNEQNGMFGSGYYLTGPAFQVGLVKEIFLSHRMFLLAESKISIAFSKVRVSGGKAFAPVAAFHLQIGPGFYFIKKERQN